MRRELTTSRLDRLSRFFESCITPEERHLRELVDANGGIQAVVSNEATLRKLYEDKGLAPLLARTADHRAGSQIDPEKEFKDLREDLKVDTETAIQRNFRQFERMFAIQQRELEEELRRSMHREGDRIIQSVTSGPHDRIVDPVSPKCVVKPCSDADSSNPGYSRDLEGDGRPLLVPTCIPPEPSNYQRWRGNVKARHFVLALRDYFREQFEEIKRQRSNGTTPTSSRIRQEDEWTLEYINVTRLQPIIEAFDDDASGFITVAEVNAFTKARPDDWRSVRLVYIRILNI